MKLLAKITMLLISAFGLLAQVPLTNPPPYVVPIATPYVASWTLATTDSVSGLNYLGGAPTNGATMTGGTFSGNGSGLTNLQGNNIRSAFSTNSQTAVIAGTATNTVGSAVLSHNGTNFSYPTLASANSNAVVGDTITLYGAINLTNHVILNGETVNGYSAIIFDYCTNALYVDPVICPANGSTVRGLFGIAMQTNSYQAFIGSSSFVGEPPLENCYIENCIWTNGITDGLYFNTFSIGTGNSGTVVGGTYNTGWDAAVEFGDDSFQFLGVTFNIIQSPAAVTLGALEPRGLVLSGTNTVKDCVFNFYAYTNNSLVTGCINIQTGDMSKIVDNIFNLSTGGATNIAAIYGVGTCYQDNNVVVPTGTFTNCAAIRTADASSWTVNNMNVVPFSGSGNVQIYYINSKSSGKLAWSGGNVNNAGAYNSANGEFIYSGGDIGTINSWPVNVRATNVTSVNFVGNAVNVTNTIHQLPIYITGNYSLLAADFAAMQTTNLTYYVQSNPSNIWVTLFSPTNSSVDFTIVNEGTNTITITNTAVNGFLNFGSGIQLGVSNSVSMSGNAGAGKAFLFENVALGGTNYWQKKITSRTDYDLVQIAQAAGQSSGGGSTNQSLFNIGTLTVTNPINGTIASTNITGLSTNTLSPSTVTPIVGTFYTNTLNVPILLTGLRVDCHIATIVASTSAIAFVNGSQTNVVDSIVLGTGVLTGDDTNALVAEVVNPGVMWGYLDFSSGSGNTETVLPATNDLSYVGQLVAASNASALYFTNGFTSANPAYTNGFSSGFGALRAYSFLICTNADSATGYVPGNKIFQDQITAYGAANNGGDYLLAYLSGNTNVITYQGSGIAWNNPQFGLISINGGNGFPSSYANFQVVTCVVNSP